MIVWICGCGRDSSEIFLQSEYKFVSSSKAHTIRVRPLSLTVRTEVSYSLMTSAQAVDILRYEFDSHRRQTSLLHFLPSPLGREYVGRYIHTYKCFIVYLHFLNILKSTRKSYLLNIFNSNSDMAKLSVSMK